MHWAFPLVSALSRRVVRGWCTAVPPPDLKSNFIRAMASETGVGFFVKVCAVVAIVALTVVRAQVQTADPAGSTAVARSSLQDDPVGESPMAIEWTPQIWQQHVASERLRVRREALQRSSGSSTPVWPTVEEQAQRASEQAFSDSTLERGDIIVTTKGFFVFKGRRSEQRLADDFEAVSSSS
jgi:hypothetical protein